VQPPAKPSAVAFHRCSPPVDRIIYRPTWHPGSYWTCPLCYVRWKATETEWRPAKRSLMALLLIWLADRL
jgi:hypothetical protein